MEHIWSINNIFFLDMACPDQKTYFFAVCLLLFRLLSCRGGSYGNKQVYQPEMTSEEQEVKRFAVIAAPFFKVF